MKNSDVYERIAQAYFGPAPVKEIKERKAGGFRLSHKFLILSLAFFLIITALSGFYYYKNNAIPKLNPTQESIAIMQVAYPLKLKYNFNWPYPDIKKISFDLPQVNLAKFQKLEVMLKGSWLKGDLSRNIKVELENRHREKDAQYLLIPNDNWSRYTINLNAFKGISDWSSITRVSFVIEKWNIANNEGVVYINDIKFSKRINN